ncbi:MAG: dienelactone hydrolase family protein [Candidatus Dormiibacterota bacterium]
MRDDIRAETVTIAGHGGDEIEAYLAQPLGEGKVGAVVVIHHMPGYDAWSKEVTRTFAAHGYLAICPNLYSRDAPGASPDDAAAAVRAKGGVPDERLVGDVGGAANHLRSLSSSNGKVGVIGYCSGGRQSFLSACSLPLEAAVICYGAFIVGDPPEGMPMKVTSLLHLAPKLGCPVLGLFGAEDQFPSPEQVAVLEKTLSDQGADFEFHTYQGAGHAFFATDRPSYRVDAAKEGWDEIWEFYGRHLSGGAA